MSWQGNLMAEQEADDYLMSLGDGERRELCGEDWIDRMVAKEKEKRREYNAKYWASHREELSKSRRERYKRDKAVILESNKRWLEKNRDHWNAYQREYRKRKIAELDKSNKA